MRRLITSIRFFLWRRKVAGMLRHWFKTQTDVAWIYAGLMRPYFDDGLDPEAAIAENQKWWPQTGKES